MIAYFIVFLCPDKSRKLCPNQLDFKMQFQEYKLLAGSAFLMKIDDRQGLRDIV